LASRVELSPIGRYEQGLTVTAVWRCKPCNFYAQGETVRSQSFRLLHEGPGFNFRCGQWQTAM